MKDDYRKLDLDPTLRGLLDYCVRLTHEPWAIEADDVDRLRRLGWSNQAIHDAVQVASYFNYINRVCDGLGVDLEDFMPPEPAGWKRARYR